MLPSVWASLLFCLGQGLNENKKMTEIDKKVDHTELMFLRSQLGRMISCPDKNILIEPHIYVHLRFR